MKRIFKKIKTYIDSHDDELKIRMKRDKILYHIYSLESLISRIHKNGIPYNIEEIQKEIVYNYKILQLEPFKMRKQLIAEEVSKIHLNVI